MLLTDLFPGTQGLHMSVSSPWQIWMGAIWRRTQNSIVYRMNHHIPNYLGVCKIKNQMLWGLPQSQPPKLNHVLTISWAARTTTLANNPRLEHIKSWIRTFPAHFMCWQSWTYVICVCTLSHGQMYFQPKIMCFALWARVDTKLLNLSHHVLSMDGWPGDATFFLLGQPLKIISMYSAKKGPAPWNLFLTPAPQPLQVTFLGWWSWTYVVAAFCWDKCFFNKKACVLHFGRALTQNSWICHIISYLWMVGLVVRLFFLWGQPLKIIRMYSAKKGPAPWNLFLTPAPRPLQVTFLVGEAEHNMWL